MSAEQRSAEQSGPARPGPAAAGARPTPTGRPRGPRSAISRPGPCPARALLPPRPAAVLGSPGALGGVMWGGVVVEPRGSALVRVCVLYKW